MNHRPTVRSAQWSDLNLLERIAVAFYLVAAIGFFALLYLAFLAAVLEWRPGAYLVVGGLTVYFFGATVQSASSHAVRAIWPISRSANEISRS